MSINRAAILAQLKLQLEQKLLDSAEVSLLAVPSAPSAKPQVVLHLGEEAIEGNKNSNAGQTRQLLLSIQTQAIPAASDVVLQALDSLAEGIEVALSDKDEVTLWTSLEAQKTTFVYSSDNDVFSATMTQHFMLEYLVLREEVCPAVPINEIYLSTQGGPHELVATLPPTE